MHVLCPLIPLLSAPSYSLFFFLSPGILDTAIVDRERMWYLVRDGTARLWGVGAQPAWESLQTVVLPSMEWLWVLPATR